MSAHDSSKLLLSTTYTNSCIDNPRTEDYPVMPCDTMTVSLKPSGFFEQNPALDVPQSTQKGNQSVLIEDKSLRKVMDKVDSENCCRKSKL